ncbi:MAG TPA: 50S ribosomal protein L17 [Candidatus Paceibacterota bacterium]|nr:50S ribosomal protein L17 [Candidatus Paceibacterota bacterium]
MRHHEKFKTLGRDKGQRASLVKSLVRSLVIHDGITTTETRAKELRKYVEPLVTTAKTGTVASRRLLASRIGDEKAAKKLVEVIAPAYKARQGGYTRVIKLPLRKSDGAKMAHIQFVK